MDQTPELSSNRSYSHTPLHRYPIWAMRFWHGMDFFTWIKLLVRNRFAVSPGRASIAASITGISAINSFAGAFSALVLGHAIRQTRVKQSPIFVLGHWRSGTTLLHELMMIDPRHTCPNTFQCMSPHHFVWTEWFVPKLIHAFLPSKRPMDAMPAGWDRPQEDEFALCNLGLPSPYLAWAFPNHGPVYDEYLDLRSLSEKERDEWKRKWLHFVRSVAYADSGRIVLKSPTHTARVRTILEVFPEAKFIHMVRDPLVVFPSTVRLWKSLSQVQGLHPLKEKNDWIEGHVLETFVRMYECFEQDRELIPSGHLIDVRYEDLAADPVEQMRRIYEQLELGSFADVEPGLMRYKLRTRDYRTNQYSLPPEVTERVRGRWAPYFQRYGYVRQTMESASA